MAKITKMLEIRHTVTQDDVQDAYDEIYDTNAIRHLDSFYRWIIDLVDPKPGAKLLDVACGHGVIADMATQRGAVGHGFDLSMAAVRAGQDFDAHLIVANGERLPYSDQTFDFITNIGSLEHYLDPEIGAQEMARVLKPGGTACILVPNSFSVANMVHAWHNGVTSDDGQPIQRFAARYEWQALLARNGLVVHKTVKYERVWPKTWADARWYLKRPKNIGWLLLTPFIPLNLANSFVYLCQLH